MWLSLIGSRKSKSFHSPQICYDADGWQTTAGSEPVQLADGQVYALRLLAAKTVEGGIAEHVVMYFYLWPNYARDPQDGMVLVKVTAPIYDSVEETVALEEDFLNALFVSAESNAATTQNVRCRLCARGAAAVRAARTMPLRRHAGSG